MNSASFSQLYPFDQYLAYRENWARAPRDEKGSAIFSGQAYEDWATAHHAQCDAMHGPVLQFLLEKARAHRLPKVAFTARRGHAFSNVWNDIADGKADLGNCEYVVRPIATALMKEAGLGANQASDSRKDYERVCSAAETGSFDWFDLDTRQKCFIAGEELCVELRDWAPRLGVFNYKNRSKPFIALEGELPAPSVNHNVFDAPSGELLIADWIRIDAFANLVDSNNDLDSLSSEAGRASRTRRYAQRFGFMSVSAGNTVPSIVRRDGQVVFARVDEDSGRLLGDVVGRVCTDLWAVTVIDRQVLTDLIAGAIGREAAEQEVATAIAAEYGYELVRIHVRPGKLHIYNTGNEYGMANFVSPEVDQASIEQVFAVLSESELTWSPKVDVPAPRRPRMR